MDEAKRWARIEEIFHGALERSRGERDSFVEQSCAGDADLARRVRSMLDAEERTGGFLDAPVARVRDAGESFGTLPNIGPYRVVRPLGAGGMGEVFLGVQEGDDFRRYAAIKVVREGVGPHFAERFARERGILAQLAHPGIARFLGGGATDDGRPYYVMEHVEGERIDDYADRRLLSIRERVELLRQVCLAVQHAHSNLVVHRDLKPSNILVTADGAPKLLDFGIAKLLSDDREDVTKTGLRMATPEYAAPEQLRGEVVSTATDVYALGVLLYELLSGHRPFSIAEANARALDTDASPPTLPSVAAGRFGPRPAEAQTETVTPEDVGAKRRSDPSTLRRTLRGDLDNIVVKALRAAPGERYISAAALADDLERYLTGRPVLARADSMAYRASKFVRRNRAATVIGAVLLITVIGAALATFAQNRQITAQADALVAERDRALEIQSFLLESFGAAGGDEIAGDSVRVRQVLDGQADRLERSESEDPQTRAEMMHVLADAYERIEAYAAAEAWARRAVDLRTELRSDADDPEWARSVALLGWIVNQNGNPNEGLALLEQSVEAWRSNAGDSVGLARALNDYGGVLYILGRYDESETPLREAYEIRSRVLGADNRAIAITANNLANTLASLGRADEALPLSEEAAEIIARDLGTAHRRSLAARRNVAMLTGVAGDWPAAEVRLSELTQEYQRLGRGQEASAALAMDGLAAALAQQGKLEEAEAVAAEALPIARAAVGQHDITDRLLRQQIGILNALRRRPEALSLARELVEVRRATLGEHPLLAEALRLRGTLSTDPSEQTSSYREAADLLVRLEGPESPGAVRLSMSLARSLSAAGEHDEALALFEELARTVPIAYGDAHPYAPAAYLGQAEVHAALGNRSAAQAALEEAGRRMTGEADVPPNRQWLDRVAAAIGAGS